MHKNTQYSWAPISTMHTCTMPKVRTIIFWVQEATLMLASRLIISKCRASTSLSAWRLRAVWPKIWEVCEWELWMCVWGGGGVDGGWKRRSIIVVKGGTEMWCYNTVAMQTSYYLLTLCVRTFVSSVSIISSSSSSVTSRPAAPMTDKPVLLCKIVFSCIRSAWTVVSSEKEYLTSLNSISY